MQGALLMSIFDMPHEFNVRQDSGELSAPILIRLAVGVHIIAPGERVQWTLVLILVGAELVAAVHCCCVLLSIVMVTYDWSEYKVNEESKAEEENRRVTVL